MIVCKGTEPGNEISSFSVSSLCWICICLCTSDKPDTIKRPHHSLHSPPSYSNGYQPGTMSPLTSLTSVEGLSASLSDSEYDTREVLVGGAQCRVQEDLLFATK